MSYVPPAISPSGLAIPKYSDYLSYLIGQFLGIYGNAAYLGPDSADYQDIAVRALQATDAAQGMQAVYLSFNPLTAIGSSLDLLGKLIGTARKPASNSSALVTLTGTPGTTVTAGIVKDLNGNLWNVASPATIGGGGTVTVIATAQQAGNITANPGEISIISTPTAGWTAVTNGTPATPGQPVELDSQYRARLLISQAKPSLTMLAGTVAAVSAVPAVTRSIVYENDHTYTASFGLVNVSGTAVTLVNGYPFDSSMVGQTVTIAGTPYTVASVGGASSLTLSTSAGTATGAAFHIGSGVGLGPSHSITAVVEGGSSADIAQAIYKNRGIGCYTNGTTLVTVPDPLNPAITMPIRFYVLAYVPVYVTLSVHPLAGFTSATRAAIKDAVVGYLNALSIGESVYFSELYGAALSARPNPEQPLFSIQGGQSGAAAAQTTGTLNNGVNTVTVASATGIATGQTVTGIGIPDGTAVSGISGTTVTLSANATVTAAGVALMFFVLGTADLSVPFNKASLGSQVNVVVNLV